MPDTETQIESVKLAIESGQIQLKNRQIQSYLGCSFLQAQRIRQALVPECTEITCDCGLRYSAEPGQTCCSLCKKSKTRRRNVASAKLIAEALRTWPVRPELDFETNVEHF